MNVITPSNIFFLIASLVSLTQLVNISHIDGLSQDFSNMMVQVVSENGSMIVPYTVVDKVDGAWIAVNVSVPEGGYTLNILAAASNASYSSAYGPEMIELSYFEGLKTDFTNLEIQVSDKNGRSRDVSFSIIAMESGKWAMIALDSAPAPYETVSFFAIPEMPKPAEGTPSDQMNGTPVQGSDDFTSADASQFPETIDGFKVSKIMKSPRGRQYAKRFIQLSGDGHTVDVERGVLDSISKNETIRVIVQSGPAPNQTKGILFGGSQNGSAKSLDARGLRVLEINRSYLSSLLSSGATAVYEDIPMSASIVDSIPLIRADIAKSEYGLGGEGISICLLDTGVDYNSSRFDGKAVSGYDFFNSDNDSYDDNGHGSFMASVIHSIAPNATIISVKVLNSSGTGYASKIIAGIDYCRQRAAADNIKVISMSFGGGSFDSYCDSDPLSIAVQDAFADGILAVASAGNLGSPNVTMPGCAMNATAVGSSNKSDSVSGFSSIGPIIDLLAPGEAVTADGMAGPSTLSGTSISAAHVSGSAALLFESNSSLSPADSDMRFKITAKIIADQGANYSRIDVYNAVIWNVTNEFTPGGVNQTNQTYDGPYDISLANISSCGIVSNNTETAYTVNTSLVGAPVSVSLPAPGNACLYINSSNMVLNCQGNTITNNASGTMLYGILVKEGSVNVTIRNCVVSNYTDGIYLFRTNNSLVDSNTLKNNTKEGIYLRQSYLNVVNNNIAKDNNDSGIFLLDSNLNNITANNASTNNWYGFYLETSYNNSYSGRNIALNNNQTGYYIYLSSNNTFTGDVASGHYTAGFELAYSTFNNLSGNNATNQTEVGYYVYYSSNNTLSYNNGSGNVFADYDVYSSDGNTLEYNLASNSTRYGFYLSNSSRNNLSSNLGASHSCPDGVGFYLYDGHNNSFRSNNASYNCNAGFNFVTNATFNNITSNIAYKNNDGFFFSTDSGFNTISSNNASNNTNTGFNYYSSDNNTIRNNLALGNPKGYQIQSVVFSSILHGIGNTFSYNNVSASTDSGFYLNDSQKNTFIYNLATGCFNGFTSASKTIGTNTNNLTSNLATGGTFGFHFESNYDTLSNNNATDNSGSGFYLENSYSCNFTDNVATRNGNYGYYVLGNTSRSLFGHNLVYNNSMSGFRITSTANSNILFNNTVYNNTYGFEILASNNTVFRNAIYNNSLDGVAVSFTSLANISGNVISNNTKNGIYVTSSDYDFIADNIVFGNIKSGIYLHGTSNNLTNNSVYGNQEYGILLYGTSPASVGDTAYSNALGGFNIGAVTPNILYAHLYNNSPDLNVTASGTSINLGWIIFDNPVGDYSNFTNLSLTDTLGGSDVYSIDWSANQSALPDNLTSFRWKFVNISKISGAVQIDSISWNWLDSELGSAYDETRFELWKYNSSGWTNTGASLNAAANTLNLTNMNPASVYGILQENDSNCPVITTAGPYSMGSNYTGAPNAASEWFSGAYACVKIASSNVTFDCNGYGIRGNGTMGTYRVGIYVNASASTNVTIKNCPDVFNYSTGIYAYQSSGIKLVNVSVSNSSDIGIRIDSCANSNVSQSSARYSYMYGFYYYLSNSLVFDNNSAYLNGNDAGDNSYGLFISSGAGPSVTNSRFYDNYVVEANSYGAYISDSNNLVFRNNSVSNNLNGLGIYGCDDAVISNNLFVNDSTSLSIEGSVNRANVTNNTMSGASNDAVFTGGGNDLLFQNNTIFDSSTAMFLQATNRTKIIDDRYYNCTTGVYLMFNSPGYITNASNLILDNPRGVMYQNFTNISFYDVANSAANSHTSISWASSPSSLPADRISFRQKFTNITQITGSNPIESFVWNYNQSELSGYNETRFELWKYNSSGWTNASAVLNTTANTLTLQNLNPASIYGILQENANNCPVIATSGIYDMSANYTGAPNNASELSAGYFACVKIISSDVIFDCKGFNITNNGTSNAMAFAQNGTLKNITIRNCANISGYYYGIYASSMNDSIIRNSTFNAASGGKNIYLVYSINNTVAGNSIYGGSEGIRLDNPGSDSQFNNISDNTIQSASSKGINLYYSGYNTVSNNSLFSCYDGIDANSRSFNNISGNRITGSTDIAISMTQAGSNNVSNNLIYNNPGTGLQVAYHNGNDFFSNNTISGNSKGVYFNGPISSAEKFYDTVLFNNTYDFQSNAVFAQSYSMSNTTFKDPTGTTYQVQINISDSVASGENYIISWVANSQALPDGYISFAQKFLNITTISGTVSIDSINWTWLDSELGSAYNDSKFGLWKYNDSSGWTNTGATLDAAANALNLTNMNPASIYGILHDNATNCPLITSSGTFTQDSNYSGAPNSITTPFSGYACVVIRASNVTFDCAGHTINRSGATGTAAGIVVDGTSGYRTNVTIKNCANISYFEYNVYADMVNNFTLYNNTLFGSTSYPLYQYDPSNYTNISNNRFIQNQNHVYMYFLNHSFFRDNTAASNSGGWSFQYSDDVDISGNNISYIPQANVNAIQLYYTDHSRISNNTIFDALGTAIRLDSSDFSSISGNTMRNVSNYGILFWGGSDYATLTDNKGNYTQFCLEIYSASNINVSFMDCRHGYFGLYTYTSNTRITDSFFYNNSYGGYYEGDNGLLQNCNFTFNLISGLEVRGNNNTIQSNLINNSASYGIITRATRSRFLNNTVSNSLSSGITFEYASNDTAANNTLFANTRGVWVTYDSGDISIENNTIYNNSEYGIYVTRSRNVTLSSNNISRSSQIGIYLRIDSSSMNLTFLNNNHLFNNSQDLKVEQTMSGFYVMNITNLVLDSPLGNYTNYTNITIYDTIASAEAYAVNWVGQPANPPAGHRSFLGKYVNITNTTPSVSIDSVTWQWVGAELPGYNENNFILDKYNSSGWITINSSPDTTNHIFLMSDLNPMSIYGIMEGTDCPVLDSQGTYVMGANYIGAPNDASEVSGGALACVKIASSNVVLDCMGYSITNNVAGTTYGILLNGSIRNVTIRNCPGVSNYSIGAYIYQSDASSIINSTAFGNTNYGFDVFTGYNNTIANSTAYANTNAGFFVSFGSNTSLTNDSAFTNPNHGFQISRGSNNAIINSAAFNNTRTGFYVDSSSDYNLVRNCTSNNNSNSGIRLSGSSFNNVTLNRVFNNTDSGIALSGGSNNNTVANNTVSYNSPVGIIVAVSNYNALVNNTAYNNLYGIVAYTSSIGNILQNNRVSNSSIAGLVISDANDTKVSGQVMFNNPFDLLANNSQSAPIVFNLSAAVFDSPSDSLVNYTNLSIYDYIEPNTAYSVVWSSNASALPAAYVTLRNKSINITGLNGSSSIDSISWSWFDSETTGLDEALFVIARYNGTWNTTLNTTPNTQANTISLSNLSLFGNFLILMNQGVTISFVDPTPPPGFVTNYGNMTANVSINTVNLQTFTYNWNGSNYTYYNDSLVLMLDFDNVSAIGDNSTKAIDLSRYRNNATIYGATYVQGKYGSALNFSSSSSQYASVADDPSLKPSRITVEAWIKPASFSASWTGIYMKTTSTSWNDGYGLYHPNLANNEIAFFVNSFTAGNASTTIPTGVFSHVVGTYNGSEVRIYVDGVLAKTTAYSSLVHSTSPLLLGNSAGGSYYFNGAIDEMRIYNYSLNPSEVLMHYQSSMSKYSNSSWSFTNNKTGLSEGTYTYYGFANNTYGYSGMTDYRNITIDFPPLIFNITVNVTPSLTGAYIMWSTSKDANGTVNYGDTQSLGNYAYNSSMLGWRNVSISGLAPNKYYYYNLTSCDGYGYCNTTGQYNFSTDFTPPNIQFVPPTPQNGSSVNTSNVIINVSVSENVSSCLIDTGQKLGMGLGTGADGALTVSSANTIVNNYTWLMQNVSAGAVVLSLNSSTGFNVNDEVLVIQMYNYSNGTAGLYEFRTISSVNGNSINVSSPLSNSYFTGRFNLTNATSTQVIRVPQYTSVTVNAASSITSSAWDGWKGGIVVFRATGLVNISGNINVTGKGYRGGTGGGQYNDGGDPGHGYQGESYCGLGINAGAPALLANCGGGGGGQYHPQDSAGGGGGAGYSLNGTNGSAWGSSPGGAAGNSYGSTYPANVYLGSGGGGGIRYSLGYGSIRNGGSGGGAIMIYAQSIDASGSGTILSTGNNGQNSDSNFNSGAGGGSGGSVYLVANSLINGSNSINISNGYGGTGNAFGGIGGNGSIGRFNQSAPMTDLKAMNASNNDANTNAWYNWTSLIEFTNYTYSATCTDAFGNSNSTGNQSFYTDFHPPIIFNITVNVTPSQTNAYIMWSTDELANGTVNFGLSSSLGTFAYNSSMLMWRNVTISVLPNKFYYYNLTSCDPAGNCNTTGPFNFSTDITPPNVQFVPPTPANGSNWNQSTAMINVSVNENVSSCVLDGLSLSIPSYGDGNDGSLTVSTANLVINNYTYLTSNATINSMQVNVNDTSAFSAGDEILIIQMQNQSGGMSGAYDFNFVASKTSSSLSLMIGLNRSYYSGIFNVTNATVTQIVRVPHYTNVTVNPGASITASAWNGWTGGIIIFRANQGINATGSINASGKGFRGGRNPTTIHTAGQQGESYFGLGRIGTQSVYVNEIHLANKGGGGGGDCSAYSGDTVGGGGGGASFSTNGTKCTYTSYSSLCGEWGEQYGNSTISNIFLGSGGGAGGTDDGAANLQGQGGAGGGIILVFGRIMNVTGSIISRGNNGVNGAGEDGGGGAGSGGTVWLTADNMSVGSNLVTMPGGTGGAASYGSNFGGDGGLGRIRLDYITITGSASSGYNSTPYNITYGFRTSMNISNNDANTYAWYNWTGLAEYTNYTYSVICTDPSGNSNTTGNQTFYTDFHPPIIFNITVNVTTSQTNAYIMWSTDELANGTVNFGFSTALGNYAYNSTMLAWRNVTLTGLTPNKFYYYNLTSCDPAGNCNTTGPFNFSTDITPPNVQFVPPTPADGSFVNTSNVIINVSVNENVSSCYYGSGESNPFGDGSSGAITVSSMNTIVNNYTYLMYNESAGNLSIRVNSTAGFNPNDLIIILQVQNASNGTAGRYESVRISSVGTNSFDLATPLNYSYYSGAFNVSNATAAQVIRVPQYTTVAVSSSGSISSPAWNGYTGGVVAFRATGTVNIQGSINVSQKGYRGGRASGNPVDYALGIAGEGQNSADMATLATNNLSRVQGGGAGQGADGSGGGGGYASSGLPGSRIIGGSYGGYGGNQSGVANLSLLFFGGGGGSTGAHGSSPRYYANGSAGGGIVLIQAASIILSGQILADGGAGQNNTWNSFSGQEGAGGGGGAGGSVFLKASNLNIGTNNVTALGGMGGNGYIPNGKNGGNGSAGRIGVYYSISYSNYTNPNSFNSTFNVLYTMNLSNNDANTYAWYNWTGLSTLTNYTYSVTCLDIAGNSNSTGNRSFFTDFYPPSVIWLSQVPADLSSNNVFGVGLNITYNITDDLAVLNSSVVLYYKTNTSTSDCWTYLNGSIGTCGYQERNYSDASGSNYTFRLYDNQIYPATYNFNERDMENTVHAVQTLATQNDAVKIQLLNVSSSKQYGFYEFMANISTGTGPLNIFYCNSSYSSGDPSSTANCLNFYALAYNQPYNHSHPLYSYHMLIPVAINTTSGNLGAVHVTPVSYFLLQPASGSAWDFYYISNISRENAIQTSTDNGNTWANFSGTVDSHLHQFDGTDALWYYACANDTANNRNCSSVRYDLMNLTGIPPTAPSVFAPNATAKCGNIEINYTQSASPNGYNLSHYNISLLNNDYSFNKTIIGNNSLNLSYLWDTSTTAPGVYVVEVRACDVLGQCSSGYSENFSFTGECTINCPEITSNGSYSQASDYAGAPNPASEMPSGGYACIKIAASNVTFDCQGKSIIYDGSGSGSVFYGIAVNDSVRNVTIKNCPAISNFTYGIMLYGANESLITNVTANNNSQGIYLQSSYATSVISSTARDNSYVGFMVYYGGMNNLTNDTAFGNGQSGFNVGNSDNNTLQSSSSYNNSMDGFHLHIGSENRFILNNAYNNSLNGFTIEYTVSSNNSVINNSAFFNLVNGIEVLGGNKESIINNSVYNNSQYGIKVQSSDNITLRQNRVFNNSRSGMLVNLSNDCILSDNSVFWNLESGVEALSATNLSLQNDSAYSNIYSGFAFSGVSNLSAALLDSENNSIGYNISAGSGILRDSRTFNNSAFGFKLGLEGMASFNITNNTALSDGNGFYANGAADAKVTLAGNNATSNANVGFDIENYDNIDLYGNSAQNNGGNGFHMLSSQSYTTQFNDNTARYNGLNGVVCESCEANISGNSMDSNNESGFFSDDAYLPEPFFNNSASFNLFHGFDMGHVYAATPIMINNTAYSNNISGLNVGGYSIDAVNDHYFNNTYDLLVNGTSLTPTVIINLTEVDFDNPAGSRANHTVLSLYDNVSSNTAYIIDWAPRPQEDLPQYRTSFLEKWVNITNISGVVDADLITWQWLESELGSSYDDTKFELWKHNESNWTLMNATPDSTSNMITLGGISLFSDYGILQNNRTSCPVINGSGDYLQVNDLIGAPNAVPELTPSAYACVKIAASDVVYDCGGFSIGYDGSSGGSSYFGVAINDSVTNVTIRNCRMISNYTYGVYAYRADDSVFSDINLSGNANDAIHFQESDRNNLSRIMAYNNSGSGISLENSGFNRITGSIAYNNSVHGFYIGGISGSDNNTLSGDIAYNNSVDGFHIRLSSNNTIVNGTSYSNLQNGYVIEYLVMSNNMVVNSTGYLNGLDGIQIAGGNRESVINNSIYRNGRNGIYLTSSDNNVVSRNRVHNNTQSGISVESGSNNSILGNIVYNNSKSGISTSSSSSNAVVNNTLYYNNDFGMQLTRGNDNLAANNTIFLNSPGGILVNYALRANLSMNNVSRHSYGVVVYASSNDSVLSDNLVWQNSLAGEVVFFSNNTRILNDHLINNTIDFIVNSTTTPLLLNMTNVIFDSPYGGFQNFTNLSIYDSVETGTAYSVRWAMNASALPADYFSFGDKFVNITNHTPSVQIDRLIWSWRSDEIVSPVVENRIELWEYNASGWTLLNASADLPRHEISYFNLSAFSNFGLLQKNVTNCPVINESGEYLQVANFSGAPNPAFPLYDYACVKIIASDVIYDCNGFAITDNGTAALYKSYGILLNGSIKNVTVKNCRAVTNYTAGIYLYGSNSSLVVNASVTNNTYGIYLDGGYNNTIFNSTSYNNSQYGFYLNDSLSNNFTGNNVTNNVVGGIRFDPASSSETLSSNLICWNGIDLANFGPSSTGRLDRCDSFISWTENGHYGCEYSCSDLWHRFFGDTESQLVLRDNTSDMRFYYWNASAFNVYMADIDSQIHWQQLQAIGRNITNGTSGDDFKELDAAFASSIFTDNISAMYSTDGTSPKDTRNYSIYMRPVDYVPIYNSTAYNTAFKTGILWDMADGGSEYGNAYNQSTVWLVRVNASSTDVYGTYDYLMQVPYTLSSQEGSTDAVGVYVEVE